MGFEGFRDLVGKVMSTLAECLPTWVSVVTGWDGFSGLRNLVFGAVRALGWGGTGIIRGLRNWDYEEGNIHTATCSPN